MNHRNVTCGVLSIAIVSTIACNGAEKAAMAAKISDATTASGALTKPLAAIGDYRALLAKRSRETVVDPRIGALAADEISHAAGDPIAPNDAGAGGFVARTSTALATVAAACKADPSSKSGEVNDATRAACAKAVDQFDATLASMANEIGDAGVSWPRVPAASEAASAKTPLGKLALGGDQVRAYWKAFDDKSADPKSIEELGNKAMGEMSALGKEVGSAAPAGSSLKDVADVQPTAFSVIVHRNSAALHFAMGAKACQAKPPTDAEERQTCAHLCEEMKASTPEMIPASLRDATAACK